MDIFYQEGLSRVGADNMYLKLLRMVHLAPIRRELERTSDRSTGATLATPLMLCFVPFC